MARKFWLLWLHTLIRIQLLCKVPLPKGDFWETEVNWAQNDLIVPSHLSIKDTITTATNSETKHFSSSHYGWARHQSSPGIGHFHDCCPLYPLDGISFTWLPVRIPRHPYSINLKFTNTLELMVLAGKMTLLVPSRETMLLPLSILRVVSKASFRRLQTWNQSGNLREKACSLNDPLL